MTGVYRIQVVEEAGACDSEQELGLMAPGEQFPGIEEDLLLGERAERALTINPAKSSSPSSERIQAVVAMKRLMNDR